MFDGAGVKNDKTRPRRELVTRRVKLRDYDRLGLHFFKKMTYDKECVQQAIESQSFTWIDESPTLSQ